MNPKINITKKRSFYLIFLVCLLFLLPGCSYFKVKKVINENYAEMYVLDNKAKKLFPDSERSFYLHSGTDVYLISDIAYDSDNLMFEIDSLTTDYYYKKGRKYRMEEYEKPILKEVHIFLNNDDLEDDTGKMEIPLSNIKEIEIIQFDYEKQTFALIGGVLITGAAVFGVSILIAILTSCPFIYSDNGEEFVFEGEIYGGAIALNLIRDDYMLLPSIKLKEGKYNIWISNELKEKQFTDLAELIIIEHSKQEKVLLDQYGRLQSLNNVEIPVMAYSLNMQNLNEVIEERDNKFYHFNDLDHPRSGIIMSFKKPEYAEQGKLLINAKNSFWFDYLFGKFMSKFGSKYHTYMQKQSEIPQKERIQRMIDCEFPLFIYIKKKDKWELVDYLYTIGPLAKRDMVIPIDLSDTNTDTIEIKLETGFMFWELDFAGMDFNENKTYEYQTIKPKKAIGTGSIDWKRALTYSDDIYMEQDTVGLITEIVYEVNPPKSGNTHAVFLHTRGYYEHIRDFSGSPKVRELKKFRKPGYFSIFSRNEFLKTQEGNEISDLHLN